MFPSPKSQNQAVGELLVLSVKLAINPEVVTEKLGPGPGQLITTVWQVLSVPQVLVTVRQTV